MDSQQAKQMLEYYRPGRDDADPQFAEALAQAQRDPDLQQWFELHRALDSVVRAKFSEITVPVWLRSRILAGRKNIHRVIWWQNPFAFAAGVVAVVLIVVASFVFQSQRAVNFDAFRQSMLQSVSDDYKMLLETNDLNQIRDFLAKSQAPSDYKLTSALETAPVEGCSIMNWHRYKVALLCFDLGNDKDLWLFVVDRVALPDAPVSGSPRFTTAGKMAMATWSQGNDVYLLAIKGDTDDLRKFL